MNEDSRIVTLESELLEARQQLAIAKSRTAAEQRVLDAAVAWGDSCEEDDTADIADINLSEAVEALAELSSVPK
jgi:hypothetical protein